MRIAQVAPLYESVPPAAHGGTERVVSYLTEELVRQGHDVTLFATGDSKTTAMLHPVVHQALRLNSQAVDHLAHHIMLLNAVVEQADRFDIIHFHVDYLHFPISRLIGWPHVTTLHGRLDLPDLQPIYDEFHDMPVVSISDAQRAPIPQANWIGTVHHGLPDRPLIHGEPAGDYLLFLGRISPEKRPDRAVNIAKKTGLTLKIAAKVDAVDQVYFDEQIRALLDDPAVEYLGEVGGDKKRELLWGAHALLFPIDWPEPFGLVMIEAMSCGTPVIAFRHGSVPEIIEEGVTGFVVDNSAEATEAITRVASFNRVQCRQRARTRFSATRMCDDYVEIYQRILSRETSKTN